MPPKSAIRNPQSAIEEIPEIRLLRRLIRQTHRHIRHGHIDYLAGMRLVARLTESLARLLQTNHRLNSAKPRPSYLNDPADLGPFPDYSITYDPYTGLPDSPPK